MEPINPNNACWIIGVSFESKPRFLKPATVLAGSLLMWGFHSNHAVLAQGSESAHTDSPRDHGQDLEEIVVTAPRALGSMRVEIDAAQDRALTLFNELNPESDYDIVCRRETPLGSHIPQRVCRPRYVDRLESVASQDFLAGDPYHDPAADILYHEDVLKQKLAALAEENSDFHEALEEYYLLKTAYESERKERFRDSWFAR